MLHKASIKQNLKHSSHRYDAHKASIIKSVEILMHPGVQSSDLFIYTNIPPTLILPFLIPYLHTPWTLAKKTRFLDQGLVFLKEIRKARVSGYFLRHQAIIPIRSCRYSFPVSFFLSPFGSRGGAGCCRSPDPLQKSQDCHKHKAFLHEMVPFHVIL